jgi:uroporphyrinogen decarboxylase
MATTSGDTMTPRERILAALRREPVDRIPYCEHLVDPLVALRAGELGLGDPEPLAQLLQRIDAARTSHDPGAAFGLLGAIDPAISRLLGRDNITYWGGAGCFPTGSYLLNPAQAHLGASADGIVKTREDAAKMTFKEIGPVVEGAKAFLVQKGDLAACALVFLGIDPCWHSMGFETFCIACLEDPGLVDAVLGPISDWYAAATEALCELDFDYIWAADDIAFKTQPLVSPRVYRELLLPHTRKVAAKIAKPWIYHSDGDLMLIWDDLLSQGMDAIHPLEAGSMDPVALKARYGDHVSFVGGVDLRVMEAGTPDETVAETRKMIDILGPGGGYLLGCSNSVTPNVKPENLVAMLRTLREYGRYPLGA